MGSHGKNLFADGSRIKSVAASNDDSAAKVTVKRHHLAVNQSH